VVHRVGLLGLNAMRVQFTFENLNRELPAGAEPEFYPCLVRFARWQLYWACSAQSCCGQLLSSTRVALAAVLGMPCIVLLPVLSH
jgi:hypothetical protein